MSRSFDGNDKLEHIAAVLTAAPFTIALWVKRSVATSTTHSLVGIYTNGSTSNLHRLTLSGSDLLQAQSNDGSVNSSSGHTLSDTTAWHHVAGVWASATSRQCFLDGTGDTANTTSRNPATIDCLKIGVRGTDTQFADDFLMAHVAIWNIALSGAEITGLAGGDNPLAVQAANLVAYYPLLVDADFADQVGDFDLTNTGTTHSTDNPTVEDPPAGGGTVNTEVLDSTIEVVDEPLDYVFYNREIESSVTLTDEFIATLVGTISRILTDTLTVDDGAVLFYRRNRMLDDVIVVTEGTLQQFTTTNLLIEDTLDVVDSVIRYAQFNRLGTDSLVITDSLISAIINYVVNVATLSSTIAVTDDEDHFVYVTRLVESTLSLFDESQSALLRFILLTDTLSVDDSATATYVPDPGTPGQVYNPVIRIGFDQPRIELGGYALI